MTQHPDAKVFIVDDDAGVRDALAWLLRTRRLLSERYDSADAFLAEITRWSSEPSVPCCLLILLSDYMLRVSTLVVVIHQLTCVLLCLGLSGIAVGLGAKMPDLREESPSKIAAGFGGTLTLVISAVYIVVIVLLTALINRDDGTGSRTLRLLPTPAAASQAAPSYTRIAGAFGNRPGR